MDVVTLSLAKKFTTDSLIGMGALRGSPCTVKTITHVNGQNIVLFEWKDENGDVYNSTMTVEDGTPIFVWTAGNSYTYGDLVIYASSFYRCTHTNADTVWDESHWSALGSANSNYGLVQHYDSLPDRFTSADRQMYYVIEEGVYYLWTGAKWEAQQSKSITNADIDNLF